MKKKKYIYYKRKASHRRRRDYFTTPIIHTYRTSEFKRDGSYFGACGRADAGDGDGSHAAHTDLRNRETTAFRHFRARVYLYTIYSYYFLVISMSRSAQAIHRDNDPADAVVYYCTTTDAASL